MAPSKKKKKKRKRIGLKAEWLHITLGRLNKVQTRFLLYKPLKEVASLADFFFLSDTLKLPAASKLHLFSLSVSLSLLAKITQHHLVKESGHSFSALVFFFSIAKKQHKSNPASMCARCTSHDLASACVAGIATSLAIATLHMPYTDALCIDVYRQIANK